MRNKKARCLQIWITHRFFFNFLLLFQGPFNHPAGTGIRQSLHFAVELKACHHPGWQSWAKIPHVREFFPSPPSKYFALLKFISYNPLVWRFFLVLSCGILPSWGVAGGGDCKGPQGLQTYKEPWAPLFGRCWWFWGLWTCLESNLHPPPHERAS